MDAPLVPWVVTSYGFIVLVVGVIVSTIGFWQRFPNRVRVSNIGMGIFLVGFVLLILPPVVNATLFMLHAVTAMVAAAYRAVYPYL